MGTVSVYKLTMSKFTGNCKQNSDFEGNQVLKLAMGDARMKKGVCIK